MRAEQPASQWGSSKRKCWAPLLTGDPKIELGPPKAQLGSTGPLLSPFLFAGRAAGADPSSDPQVSEGLCGVVMGQLWGAVGLWGGCGTLGLFFGSLGWLRGSYGALWGS